MPARLLTSPYFAKGLALLREAKAKVQVVRGVTQLCANGKVSSTRSAIRWRPRETIPADLLLLHQGVVPNVNLAMAAGVRASLGQTQLCWSPGGRRERQFAGRRHRHRGRRRRHRRRACRRGARPHRGARGGGSARSPTPPRCSADGRRSAPMLRGPSAAAPSSTRSTGRPRSSAYPRATPSCAAARR